MTLEAIDTQPLLQEILRNFEIRYANGDIVITFDIDGVLADTASEAVRLFNRQYGQNRQTSDMLTYMALVDWCNELEIENPKESAIALWNSDEALGGALPEGGATLVIDYLCKLGIAPHLVTSRPYQTRDITTGWVSKYFPDIPIDNIHLQPKPEDGIAVINSHFKAQKVATLSPTFHFEDSTDHAREILAASAPTDIVLVRQPWNKAFVSNDRRIIVPAYDEPGKVLAAFSKMIFGGVAQSIDTTPTTI